MPIAVPSSASPKLRPSMREISVSWSSVSGQSVNAVPANPTTPMRSCERPRAKSRAVARATSSLVPPPMSEAFMLREMSMASTMSTPRVSTSLCWTPACGRAAATIPSDSTSHGSTRANCSSHAPAPPRGRPPTVPHNTAAGRVSGRRERHSRSAGTSSSSRSSHGYSKRIMPRPAVPGARATRRQTRSGRLRPRPVARART